MSQDQELMKGAKLKSFTMFGLEYFISIQNESIMIYNTKNLKVIQQITGLEEKIINVYFLQNRNFLVVLCKRRLYFYSCVYTQVGTIKWVKKLDSRLQV